VFGTAKVPRFTITTTYTASFHEPIHFDPSPLDESVIDSFLGLVFQET